LKLNYGKDVTVKHNQCCESSYFQKWVPRVIKEISQWVDFFKINGWSFSMF